MTGSAAHSVACTARRHALIIANSEYNTDQVPLRCPVHDAHRMEKELKLRGFQVRVALEQSKKQMIDVIADFVLDFKDRLQSGSSQSETLLLYYSGHAMLDADNRPHALTVDRQTIRLHKLFVEAACRTSSQSPSGAPHAILSFTDVSIKEDLGTLGTTNRSNGHAPGQDPTHTAGNLVLCAYPWRTRGEQVAENDVSQYSAWATALFSAMEREDDVIQIVKLAKQHYLVKQAGVQPFVMHEPGTFYSCSLARPHSPTAAQRAAEHERAALKGISVVAAIDADSEYADWGALPEGSSIDEVREFVHRQLDALVRHAELAGGDAVLFLGHAAVGAPGEESGDTSRDGSGGQGLSGGLRLTYGPLERINGGQAVVQMAECTDTGTKFAIKFYLTQNAFKKESFFRTGASIGFNRFLRRAPQPMTWDVVDAADDAQAIRDPHGHAMPSCIVTERGLSLQKLLAGMGGGQLPPEHQVVAILRGIAQTLSMLHDTGFVHRNVKPGNALLLAHSNQWTVVDFGFATREGETALPGCTPQYGPPEVIHAFRNGEELEVSTTQDAWSLGVMAFELLQGQPWAAPDAAVEQVMDTILGANGLQLPWEETHWQESDYWLWQLVSGLLLKDPGQRLSVRDFAAHIAPANGSDPSRSIESMEDSEPPPLQIEEICNVLKLAEALSGHTGGVQLDLSNKTLEMPSTAPTATPGASVGAGSSPQLLDISQPRLLPGSLGVDEEPLVGLVERQSVAVVVSLVGAGTTVTGGHLKLTPEACIVIDGTCEDVHFKDVTITDGAIVCKGHGCHASFTSATFTRCCLVAVDGAKVTVSGNSSFDRPPSSRDRTGVSIFASGPDTSVSVLDAAVTGGVQGAAVRDGAVLEASRTRLSGFLRVGIDARGPGTSMQLSYCVAEVFAGASSEIAKTDPAPGFGFGVLSGANANLQGCTATNGGGLGVIAIGKSTKATMGKCRVTGCRRGGLRVAQGAAVEASECRCAANLSYGVLAEKHAKIELKSCGTSENSWAGYTVREESTLHLLDCRSEWDLIGVVALSKATLRCEKLKVLDCTYQGLIFDKGSTGDIADTVVGGANKTGLDIAGADTTITMRNSKVMNGKQTALSATANAAVELYSCKFKNNQGCGVVVSGDAKLFAEGCACEANTLSAFQAQRKGQMKLVECSSTGDREGYVALDEAVLEGERLTVKESCSRGYSFQGGARVELNECCAESSGNNGSFISDEGTSVLFRKCTMESCNGNGVLLEKHGQAEMQDCRVVMNKGCGVVARTKARVTVARCESDRNGLVAFKAATKGKISVSEASSRGDRTVRSEEGGSITGHILLEE